MIAVCVYYDKHAFTLSIHPKKNDNRKHRLSHRYFCRRRSPAPDTSPGAFLSCHDLWGHDTKTPHSYSVVLSFIIPAARNSGNRYIIISEKFVIQHLVSVSSCRITPHRKSCHITILVSVSLRSCCQEGKN